MRLEAPRGINEIKPAITKEDPIHAATGRFWEQIQEQLDQITIEELTTEFAYHIENEQEKTLAPEVQNFSSLKTDFQILSQFLQSSPSSQIRVVQVLAKLNELGETKIIEKLLNTNPKEADGEKLLKLLQARIQQLEEEISSRINKEIQKIKNGFPTNSQITKVTGELENILQDTTRDSKTQSQVKTAIKEIVKQQLPTSTNEILEIICSTEADERKSIRAVYELNETSPAELEALLHADAQLRPFVIVHILRCIDPNNLPTELLLEISNHTDEIFLRNEINEHLSRKSEIKAENIQTELEALIHNYPRNKNAPNYYTQVMDINLAIYSTLETLEESANSRISIELISHLGNQNLDEEIILAIFQCIKIHITKVKEKDLAHLRKIKNQINQPTALQTLLISYACQQICSEQSVDLSDTITITCEFYRQLTDCDLEQILTSIKRKITHQTPIQPIIKLLQTPSLPEELKRQIQNLVIETSRFRKNLHENFEATLFSS